MKHTFAKKALLMGAAVMLLSTVPVHAMDTVRGIRDEVAQKTGFFARWSKDALQKRLDASMNFLNKQWRGFMKCVKGEGCTKGQTAAIIGTLTTVSAIVTALGALTYGALVQEKIITGRGAVPYEKTKEAAQAVRAQYEETKPFVTKEFEKFGKKFQWRRKSEEE